jgi:hypothetical protein
MPDCEKCGTFTAKSYNVDLRITSNFDREEEPFERYSIGLCMIFFSILGLFVFRFSMYSLFAAVINLYNRVGSIFCNS